MNIPNILTVSRIVMIAIAVALSAFCGPRVEPITDTIRIFRIIVMSLAFIAGITDLLDGYLARKWNQITDFGALMDPLADKIFVASCMLIAVEYRLMPSWIAIAVLSREFMVTGLRSLAAKKGVVIAADKFGKLKTAMQMVMLALAGSSWIGCFDLWSKYTWQWYVWIVYLCCVVFVTMYSGLGYFVKYRDVYMDKK